jgi:hypothetical protein
MKNTLEKQPKAVPFRGQINLSGVIIKWSSSMRMSPDESGDWDSVGSDLITLSAPRPVSADEMRYAMSRVEVLEKARKCESRLHCPYTDAQIIVTGLDESGHLMVQVIRDGVPRGHDPAWSFSDLIPENYSKAGEAAMRSIGFIRDACKILSRSETVTLADMQVALHALIDTAREEAVSRTDQTQNPSCKDHKNHYSNKLKNE